jgi:hypothetical protein
VDWSVVRILFTPEGAAYRVRSNGLGGEGEGRFPFGGLAEFERELIRARTFNGASVGVA